MSRLADLVRRKLKIRSRPEADGADMKEIDRLNREYTGSFARNAGQEMGVLPPRYGRK